MDDQKSNQIPEIPDIPEGIEKAAHRGKLIVFVGAGVSQIIGGPSWQRLATDCLEHTYSTCKLKYSYYTALKEYPPRKLLTICLSLLKKAEESFDFDKALTFDPKKEEEFKIYNNLYKWNVSYITTNYDTGFKKAIEKHLRQKAIEKSLTSPSQEPIDVKQFLFYGLNEILPSNLDQGRVLFLHGNLEDRNNLIVTLDDYIKRYGAETKGRDFLKNIFREFTVLFMGYGLAEYEILEHLIPAGADNTHFILLPFLSKAEELIECEKEYYKKLSVDIIPYNIDRKGYDQLSEIIEAWSAKITGQRRQYYDQEQIIRNGIKEGRFGDEDILNYITQKQALASVFFSEIQDKEWFASLSEKGFFSPTQIPLDGTYWPPLDYLTKLSLQIKEGRANEYIDSLLLIIKNVTEYKTQDKYIQNHFVWFKFIEMLSNLPKERIHAFLKEKNIKLIEWLRVWVDHQYNRTLVSTDLIEKILPRFIKDSPTPEDIELAQTIVQKLLEVEYKEIPTKDALFSRKKKEAILKVNADYGIDELINKGYAKQLGRICQQEFLEALINEVREILQYEFFDTFIDLAHENTKYRIVLQHTEQQGSAIRQKEYEVIVRTLSPEEDKEDLKATYSSATLGKEIGRFLLSEIGDQKYFLEEFGKNISKLIPIDLTKEKDRIKELYENLNTDFSGVWMTSIREGSEYRHNETKETLITVVRDLLLGKAEEAGEASKKILHQIFQKVLTDEYRFPVFRRMLLLIATDFYEEFGKYFKELIDINPNIFYISAYKYELFELLRKNYQAFRSQPERGYIEQAIMFKPPLLGDYPEQSLSYQRLQYFKALEDDPYFKQKIDEIKGVSGIEKVDAPKIERSVTWSGNGQSFYTVEWFLEHSNEEIVDTLNALKSEEAWGPQQKTVEGTAEALKEAIKIKPDKFILNLPPFVNLRFICVNYVLRAFQDAWNAKVDLDRSQIFQFIISYVEGDYFKKTKEDPSKRSSNYQSWVISAAADLISTTCNDDARKLPIALFGLCEDALNILLKQRYEEEPKKADIQQVINTSFGRAVEAFLTFSFQKAQVYQKEGRDKDFKTATLDALFKANVPEAYTHFGRFLRQMIYLNKEWTLEKIKEFEGLSPESILWKGFFQGYIWSSNLYDLVFNAMQVHYKTAIATELDYDQVQSQIIEHAVIVFLSDVQGQNLEDKNSLIRIILETNIADKWKGVAQAFWARTHKTVEEMKEDAEGSEPAVEIKLEKAKKFWSWALENDNARNRLGEKYGDFLLILIRLIIIFEHIDTTLSEQIKKMVPFTNKFNDSHFLVEYLNRYEDRNDLEQVGDIYLELLKYSLPLYDSKNIQSIVSKLYRSGFKEKADKICDIYGNQGVHFLRELRKKNIEEAVV